MPDALLQAETGGGKVRIGVLRRSHVANNPINLTDPMGLWAGIDDAIFMGGGAAVGVAGRIVGDLLTGNRSNIEDYAGAAVGGAAAGGTLLYTANPFLAGATGGLAGNLATQGLKNLSGKQCGVDVGSAVFDTALATVFEVKPKLHNVHPIGCCFAPWY